jgi:Zn finger protein HypA/HybF involved in hydrogenase expression
MTISTSYATYKKLTKVRNTRKTWKCMECDKEFNSKARYELTCPRCHGVEIDLN